MNSHTADAYRAAADIAPDSVEINRVIKLKAVVVRFRVAESAAIHVGVMEHVLKEAWELIEYRGTPVEATKTIKTEKDDEPGWLRVSVRAEVIPHG